MLPSRKLFADGGSAIVEFVLVSVPLVLLSLSIIGLSLASYTRLVLIDAAVEGAHYAALADQTDESGCAKAKEVFTKALAGAGALRVTCSRSQGDGATFAQVTLATNIPGLGLIPFGNEIRATSKAFSEIQ